MNRQTTILLSMCALLACSCGKKFARDDFKAWFGGEIKNPQVRYVLFCKDGEVLDTIPLKANNTFFKEFDSLTPGMYSFRHDPEFQYVYFDKNDSLMVHVNTRDFDESVVFCGRGDQKNNFLMEQFLRAEKEKDEFFKAFDLKLEPFGKRVDSLYEKEKKIYAAKKEKINWSPEFDRFAKAAMEYNYLSKKELYPMVHQLRTGQDVIDVLPKDYYGYRDAINLNDSVLSGYSPYVNYLTHLINNMAAINYHNHFSQEDLALKTNLNKLDVAAKMIKNEKVRNIVLNNIAFSYLLEDQKLQNNQQFLDRFHRYSTDDIRKNEITRIGNAIQLLRPGNHLPEARLVDVSGASVNSDSFQGKTTVIFCWTTKFSSHFYAAHQKAEELQRKHPEIQVIAINVDADPLSWHDYLAKLKPHKVRELRAVDFQKIRDVWAITKIHRTIILNPDGRIKNAFTNLFDVNFEKEL